MNQQPSPYTPGSVTPVVPGREQQLTEIRERLAYVETFGKLAARIRVDVGPRGIGKTSLLRAAQRDAAEHGFATVWVTAGDAPFLSALATEFEAAAHTWKDTARDSLIQALQQFSVSVGPVSFRPRPGAAPVGNPSGGRALQTLIRTATETTVGDGGRGLAVFVDELQSADGTGLRALGYAWQHMQSEDVDLPALCITAGLSHTQDVLTDAVSFAERFQYTHLATLSRTDTDRALVELAAPSGVSWSPDALESAWSVSMGYPYFIQLIADEMWRAAGYPGPGRAIDAGHFAPALAAFRSARADFFRARWTKATERESELLVAMAEIGGTAIRRGAIADSLGTSTQALSMARRSLMDKGLIEAAGHGKLRFTAPGFETFIRSEILES